MSRIVELATPHDIGDLLMKGELTPDFRIFTAAAEATDPARPIVRMIGSSTEKDLQGDTMTVNALADMCKIAPNLSVFLNHQYDLPDKLFGSIVESPTLIQQDGIADLHLTVEVEMDNPAAAKTYKYIQNGRRLGCSVGCMVTKYEVADEEDGDDWFWMPIIIQGVYVVEFSVVSIPANQRSWVENAVKGAFARTLDPAFVPAMKSMWSKEYAQVVKGLDAERRRAFDDLPTRPNMAGRLDWEPKTKSFWFTQRGKSQLLQQPQVVDLLNKSATALPILHKKAVCGKTSWTLMALDTEWTGSKAEKDIFEYADDGDGGIAASKAKQGFLNVDPDQSDKRGGYKMPFCYAGGDGLKIVPLGVRACANVLSGGMGGVSASEEDKNGMKAKVKTMYGRINSELKPDPTWVVPWEKDEEEKSMDTIEIGGVLYVKNADGSLTPATYAENADGVQGILLRAGGDHDDMTGTHSHSHKAFGSQGDDETHSHSHSHDGDSNHQHTHDEEKAGEAAHTGDGEQKTGEEAVQDAHIHAVNKDGSEGILLKSDGNHDATTATHSHVHAAYGGDATSDDGSHAHSHSHDGDANHEHDHGGSAAGDEEEKQLDASQVLLLNHYNQMGKSLGLPGVSETDVLQRSHPITTRKGVDMQNIVTCVSSIDQLTDSLEAKVDYLMAELGIPDYDPDESGDTSRMYSVAATHVLKFLQRVKEGKRNSDADMQLLSAIHDAAYDLTDGMVCGMRGNGNGDAGDSTTLSDAERAADEAMGRRDMQQALAPLFEELKGALGGLNVKVFEADLTKAQTTLDAINRHVSRVWEEAREATATVRSIKGMPLGRPTQHARTVEPSAQGETTFEELASIENSVRKNADNQTSDEALALTTEDEETLRNGRVLKLRVWPAEAANRPALTSAQKISMAPSEVASYLRGEEARVPMIG